MKRTGNLSSLVDDIWSGKVGTPKPASKGIHTISDSFAMHNPHLHKELLDGLESGEYTYNIDNAEYTVPIGSKADKLATAVNNIGINHTIYSPQVTYNGIGVTGTISYVWDATTSITSSPLSAIQNAPSAGTQQYYRMQQVVKGIRGRVMPRS